jgi:hypothetical protein
MVFWTTEVIERNIKTVSSLQQLCLIPDSRLAIFSALKMEAICSFGASVDLQRITWRYIPQDRAVL